MLVPDSLASRIVLAVVLAALIGLLVYRSVRKERNEYQRFKRFERTRNRQRMMRKWLIDSIVVFGGAAVVILALTWQYVPRLLSAVDDWPISQGFRTLVESSGGVIPGLAVGFAIALVGGTVLAVFVARKSVEIPTIGDIGALLPQNAGELRYGVALSVNAGLVEELLFRLAIPALIFGVIGNALIAVIAAVLIFGALHIYQGWQGIIGTILIGGVLMVLFLATGSILVAIVAHALIDLRSLVLIPMLVYRVHTVRP